VNVSGILIRSLRRPDNSSARVRERTDLSSAQLALGDGVDTSPSVKLLCVAIFA